MTEKTEQYTASPIDTTDQLKLAVIREIAHLAGNPDDALAAARSKLETLHNEMTHRGDDTTALIEAWHNIESLYHQSNHAIDIAAAARAIAADLQSKLKTTATILDEERNNHQQLRDALNRLDTEHPQIDQMRQNVIEEYAESGAFISYCPGCEMIDNLVELDHSVANEFHDYLFNDEDLTVEESEELEEFITGFITRVRLRQLNRTP